MPEYEIGVKRIEPLVSTPRSQDSAANSAQTLTINGTADKSHYITSFEVLISGAAAANDIFIILKDGATTVWKEVIGSGAPRGDRAGIVFFSPIKITAGNAVSLAVDAGGTGVITTANVAYYTS